MSDSDKKALLDGTATIQTEIEILPQNEGEDSVILTEKNSIVSWDYEDFRYVKDQGFIGQFVARQVNGVVKNISDDFVITDREFVLRMGVNTPLPYERINLSYDAENDKYFIDGKSEQETTKGTNLLDLSGLISTSRNGVDISYKDGKILLNGTSSDIVDIYILNTTWNTKADEIKSNLNTNLGSYRLITSNPKIQNYWNMTSGYVINTVEVTVDNQINTAFLRIPNGMTFDNELLETQIVKGTSVLPWEKYTGGQPSPSPEFPSEIKNKYNAGTYQTRIGRDNYEFTIPADLSSIGDLQNELVIDKNNNSFEFTQKIGKYVVDNNTPIYVVTSPVQENSKFYTIDLSGFTGVNNTSVQIMSNIFSGKTANQLWASDEKNYCSLNTYSSIHIRVDSSLASVGDVRRYLIENNAYFIGVLTEPIVTTGSITKKEHNTNWYSFGNFLVNKVTDDEVNDKTTFEALDYTKKFNQKYVSRVTYPCTLVELASDVCNQCGCELGNTDFKHNDWEIDGEYFTEGQSCRDVMKEISKLAYSWVRIDWDNKVYLDFTVKKEVDNYNRITNHEYYNLKTQKEKFGAVNRVVIGYKDIEGERTKVEDAESIEANGVHEITIYNNPLVHSQELREKAIIGAEDLLGLEYMPLETLTLGHPWLKGYELVEAVDMEGKVHKTIPFDRTIQYFGHIKTKITSGASTRTNTQYAYNADLEKRLVRAEISVNKNEGKIESVVSDTEIIKTNVNGISTNLNNNFYSKDQVDAMQEENNENIETVTNTVQNIQTSTQSQINVIQETIANGVSKVSTTSGTFDENGLNIAKTGEEMSSTLDWDGLEVVRDKGKSTETEVLTVRSAGVESENMTVRKYLTQRPIRQEKTKAASDGVSVGLGFFYVGEE